MAAPRLPFLYPSLMRAVRSCQPKTYRSLHSPHLRAFHATRGRHQQAYHRRYGPAVEPNIPPPSKPKEQSPEQSEEEIEAESPAEEQPERSTSPSEQSQSQTESQSESPSLDSSKEAHEAVEASEASAINFTEQIAESIKTRASLEPEIQDEDAAEADSPENASSTSSSSAKDVGEEMSQMPPYASQSAFEEVYHMPSPSTHLTPAGPSTSSGERPPHLSPAPYVHHFDTYSLVLDLHNSGFSNEQSVTIMKAVRSILQNNLDYAKQSLTSKSDEENESYLFKAACSELQQSLQTARNSEIQRQRASRGQLEHEIDILSQRLNQELTGMKDDIKGMFNDHKMSTREQQRTIDTSVQELNYKITVSLNSDGKSEAEGLRWILTRRAALTVATCAFMIIVFLKYASTRKVPEPKVIKEVEKPVPTKEVTKETPTRVVHESGHKSETPYIAEAHLVESLG
ncbi:hypothetical protein N7532_002511 [Penicillium argentinense]|uniref:MOZ protein represents a chromatin-associated acetyltransferase n=1 Tax=Penicillium argentinense TaxID=1131581 RepID=A0A9W9G0N7_9EURO|nr:uncharacterized protein N7532_002511 [Penicillium argentinense]KAJ5109866.1 hypothetical protein N7532_002511 [Penicillium argentinense]